MSSVYGLLIYNLLTFSLSTFKIKSDLLSLIRNLLKIVTIVVAYLCVRNDQSIASLALLDKVVVSSSLILFMINANLTSRTDNLFLASFFLLFKLGLDLQLSSSVYSIIIFLLLLTVVNKGNSSAYKIGDLFYVSISSFSLLVLSWALLGLSDFNNSILNITFNESGLFFIFITVQILILNTIAGLSPLYSVHTAALSAMRRSDLFKLNILFFTFVFPLVIDISRDLFFKLPVEFQTAFINIFVVWIILGLARGVMSSDKQLLNFSNFFVLSSLTILYGFITPEESYYSYSKFIPLLFLVFHIPLFFFFKRDKNIIVSGPNIELMVFAALSLCATPSLFFNLKTSALINLLVFNKYYFLVCIFLVLLIKLRFLTNLIRNNSSHFFIENKLLKLSFLILSILALLSGYIPDKI